MNTHFSCVGCGKCCSDHHVPLTLEEARSWAADGGNVIVLVEGFLGNGLGLPLQQREHAGTPFSDRAQRHYRGICGNHLCRLQRRTLPES